MRAVDTAATRTARPILGRDAPMPRQFTARRLSDLNPYAWLDTDEAPGVLDRIIGRLCAAGFVVAVGLLVIGVL